MAKITKEAALAYHAEGKPGKIEVVPTKPYSTQTDLSLAYSPGVAEPCLEIQKNPDDAYKYTSKGNLVAVISNGTAVLGLGDIGAMSGKPVMEGKGLLFKIYGGIDVFDIEVNEKDPEKFIQAVKAIAPTFGGINLEDIKAPECFEIERRLKAELDIPVMHDDQHGTAIISSAGLINALEVSGKKIEDVRIVVNGAGAAAISCTKLYVALGARKENILMLDSKGVITDDREKLTPEKKEFATSRHDIHTGGSCQACRRIPWFEQGWCALARYGTLHGRYAHRVCPGQSRTRDNLRGCHGGTSRCAHVNRSFRLPQPDKQCNWLPLHLPWCLGHSRHCYQRGDEVGCRACHCRIGKEARS